ncbi:hypothetical protein BDZ91DRAFT_541411 [Kalaharituber pfeilii]|nr:hypothetical protein BDZ91DRAFT_541411 [Kalaharituber pfeilii]
MTAAAESLKSKQRHSHVVPSPAIHLYPSNIISFSAEASILEASIVFLLVSLTVTHAVRTRIARSRGQRGMQTQYRH